MTRDEQIQDRRDRFAMSALTSFRAGMEIRQFDKPDTYTCNCILLLAKASFMLADAMLMESEKCANHK